LADASFCLRAYPRAVVAARGRPNQEGSIAELAGGWAEALARPVKRLVAGESDEGDPKRGSAGKPCRDWRAVAAAGLSAQTIRDVLHAANARQRSPPLDARKIEAMAADTAARYRPAVTLARSNGNPGLDRRVPEGTLRCRARHVAAGGLILLCGPARSPSIDGSLAARRARARVAASSLRCGPALSARRGLTARSSR
jgi:hypothetical protein